MDDAFVFHWTIEQFLLCEIPTGKPIYSPVFVADTPYQTHWRLKLYPKGKVNERDISCFLECHKYNEKIERHVDFDIGIVDINNVALCSSEKKNVLITNGLFSGFPELMPRNYLMEHQERFLAKGALRIQCRLRSTLPVLQQVEDLDALSETFNKLLTLGCFSDVTLKGEEVNVSLHKDILRARSPKFCREINYLQSQTKPNQTQKHGSKIPVSDQISDGLLRALPLYLYSGVLKTTEPVVWDQLYEAAEAYELYDMKRDIFPTTSASSVRTRVQTFTNSVIFTIENFRTALTANMGRLIDFDFGRLSVEYFVNDNQPDSHKVGFLIWCYTDDLDCTDRLECTVSVIDVNGTSHFPSTHTIRHDDSVTTMSFPSIIWKKELLNDLFMGSDGAIRVKFTFTTISGSGALPNRIETEKTGNALCLGHESPSCLTLRRLSEDFRKLMMEYPLEDIDPLWMKSNAVSVQKAIFCAWSPEYEVLLTSKKRKSSSCSNTPTEISAPMYQFLCTGRITLVSLEIAIILCSVAEKYKINTLQKVCHTYIESKLTVDNAMMALVWADKHRSDCNTLIENFVCRNCESFTNANEWQYLTMSYPAIAGNIANRLGNQ